MRAADGSPLLLTGERTPPYGGTGGGGSGGYVNLDTVAAGGGGGRTRATPPPTHIAVTILSARGLSTAEGDGDGATANPWVTLAYGGRKYTTSVVAGNRASPQWGERFTFAYAGGARVRPPPPPASTVPRLT